MKNYVIIDADGLIYHSSKQDLKESIDILDEKIQNILNKTRADYYSMFISMGSYFRHKVNPTYKSNRKQYPSPLLWVRTLKDYLIEGYGAIASKDVEADDLCKYFYNKNYASGITFHAQMTFDGELQKSLFISNQGLLIGDGEEVRVILATPDKDLLKSIPGTHFNYSYKLENKDTPEESLVKGTWITTTKDEAYQDIWYKMIEGDSTDGIIGLRGKGRAFAKSLYSDEGRQFYDLCLEAYVKHYNNETEAIVRFQENYRMLHILENDGDFLREVGYLPEFTYRDVISLNKSVEEEVREEW